MTIEQPDVPSWIKRTLYGRLFLQLQSEFYHEEGKRRYDTEFLSRISVQSAFILKRYERFFWLVLTLDLLIILFSNGDRFNFNFNGNNIADFPNLVEIMYVGSSMLFASTVILLIDVIFYRQLVEAVGKAQCQNLEPVFFAASFLPGGFFARMVAPYPYGYSSGKAHVLILIVYAISILVYLFTVLTFHGIACFSALRMLVLDKEASFVSKLLMWVGTGINAFSVFLIFSLFVFRFTFKISNINPTMTK